MGHLSNVKKEYLDLQRRLDKSQSSLPESPEVFEILKIMYTEEEARLALSIPFKPTKFSSILKRSGKSKAEIEPMLDRMAKKGLVIDLYNERKKEFYFALAPPVVGFFEFSMMRARPEISQKRLAALFDSYVHSKGEIANVLFGGDTQIGRALVHETALSEGDFAEVLPFERATEIVKEARCAAVSLCFCRHVAMHRGKPCRHPVENCISLNGGAEFVVRHGHGRQASREEVLDLLSQAREADLVQICDNVKMRPTYICNCCGCCCGQLLAISKFGLDHAVKTSRFIAEPDIAACAGCGRCARACPIQAVTMLPARPEPGRKQTLYAKVDAKICLGCGVCAGACKKKVMAMKPRKERVLTPSTTLERVLRMNLERGRLQNMLFDDRRSLGFLFMNRFTGAVLKLPPVKRALANEQLKSRFIAFLMDGVRKVEGSVIADF